jgi:hypothetical protein
MKGRISSRGSTTSLNPLFRLWVTRSRDGFCTEYGVRSTTYDIYKQPWVNYSQDHCGKMSCFTMLSVMVMEVTCVLADAIPDPIYVPTSTRSRAAQYLTKLAQQPSYVDFFITCGTTRCGSPEFYRYTTCTSYYFVLVHTYLTTYAPTYVRSTYLRAKSQCTWCDNTLPIRRKLQ